MRKRRIRFSSFLEGYRTRLNEIVTGPDTAGLESGFVHNARMMLLLAEQPDVRQVAKHLGQSIKHVQRMRARFAQLGLPGLHDAPALSRSKRQSKTPRFPTHQVLEPAPPASCDEPVLRCLQIHTLRCRPSGHSSSGNTGEEFPTLCLSHAASAY